MRHLLLLAFLLLICVPLSAQTWVIDAGHGGYDCGCEGQHTSEKVINLRVAQEVARRVRTEMRGVKVVMTRDQDQFVSLENRCRIANSARADLFLSIHVNAAPESGTVRGTESYFGPLGGTMNFSLEEARRDNIGKSEMLARLIQRSYSQSGRPSTRGVKQERYWVVLHTMMPSVLTEVGFISTPTEEDFLSSDEGVRSTADCIFEALKAYRQSLRERSEGSLLAELRRRPFGDPSRRDITSASTSLPPAKRTRMAAATAAPREAAAPAKTDTTRKDTSRREAPRRPEPRKETPRPQAPAPKPAPKPAPATDKTKDSRVEFRVQLCSVKTLLKETDKRFKGVAPIAVMPSQGIYKYYYGSTPDYKEARTLQKEMDQLFPGAFLVAFKDGTQISIADAKEMYKDYLK